MVELAKLMVAKNNELPMYRGDHGLIPFGTAAEIGHKEMARYLYGVTGFDHLDGKERTRLFFICLSNDLYDLALEILKRYPTMAYERDEEDKKTALHVLAQKDITFSNGKNIMEGCTTSNFRAFFNQDSSPNYSARELLESLWKQILQCSNAEEISDLIRMPSGVLFDAAKSGNVEFLAVLLRSCPELFWEWDEKNRTLFHVAIIYRQVHVFNLIYNLGTVRDYIIGFIVNERNSMLHLAGMLPATERLGALRANLQMQREILWFKEVEKISRPSHLNMRNGKGMTPREVFNAEHKELLKVGEKAMKETANSCMLVATLISTVVFAAALCVPGASNQLNTPFLTKEEWFMIFVLSNALSLFTSTASIVLSILTSSYAESEFVKSLHARLMFGLTTLFISITTMVLAFIAAIFLIFDYNLTGVPYAIVLLHFNLWADLIRSYYWSKFLFQPSKYKIFE
ncbi:ankyrin repeat-containing protein ITN1-like [Quercus lobata]|nr:ankyrin repeat-containing protein ITN1-like [Quercus lobata]XP_030942870.1 ankyrin repeat-containing protein ITN1-like [Quercus lobata]XP_030942871.1 ankyrin repeat-containing protein ITN1-like [Quercus lobata]